MRTIFILLDSLNRHYLNAYGSEWVKTPNIDRLTTKSIVFDNHYAGSMPCMPARREMWTGRYNFLETPWCPLQPFDRCVTTELRSQKGTYSHLISDHYHYWEMSGTGYNLVFDTWEFVRGQEGDPWMPMVGEPYIPEARGRGIAKSGKPAKLWRQDWVNRSFMDPEKDEDYPTVKCFQKAEEFIHINHKEDNWHLHLEVFDPHEPFFCPTVYRDRYKDNWGKPYHFDWPDYAPVDSKKEGPEAMEHIRKCYAACVTRADKWLGKLLDRMDQYNMWEDTTVILTTDHGHLLGDHGYWGKNYMFDFNELIKIPLIIYYPGADKNGKRVSALTATIDLAPTLMDIHSAEKPMDNIHGRSLKHLFDKDEKHHDWILYGYFGKDVSMTDGRYTYTRQPAKDSFLYEYTANAFDYENNMDAYHGADMGRFLSHTDMPVYRVKRMSYLHHNAPEYNLIYDTLADPYQRTPIMDEKFEKDMEVKMMELLKRYQAPEQQFVRLKLDTDSTS